ncbi:MAG TPA: glutamine-hydrolyzing GMP synthase [Treponemataceae bacterium]|nr:glutamine-hydrolyzing GMP synthase [Treponemataceae bacterium]
MVHEKIVVLDFGSQYAHLIAKRFRLMGYYSEIAQPSAPVDSLADAKGIVFSGGPSSVYEEDVPAFNPEILNLDIPILGLCYGHQLLARDSGGEVTRADVGEFGIAHLVRKTADGRDCPTSPLFEGIDFPAQVWMSHQDAVSRPAPGYEVIATTKDCPYAALQNLSKKRFSLQCHVEVKDTPDGDRMLANFAHNVCGMAKNWSQDRVLEVILDEIREVADGQGLAPNGSPRDGKKRKVLLFLSGGVDSTVAFALLNRAIGQDRVLGLHIDNGFMRKNESAVIADRYREFGFTNFIVEDASETFLKAVYRETDPQKKRKAIGETFITVRNEVVARLKLDEEEWLLGQGTLYPDIIESGGTKNSQVIKTHHNRVAGIQALIEKGLIIEPLKDLYKDEVRAIGKKVGLSDPLVFRHPFPGPGLSINVLCSAGGLADAADFTRAQKEIAKTDLAWAFSATEPSSGAACSGGASSGDKSKPAFSRIDILPVKSVGVQGDFRTYRYPAVLAFEGIFGAFPSWNELERASSKVTNASRDVNRAILLLWERAGFEGKKAEDASGLTLREGYCDKTRLDQTREADAIVLEELKASRWYAKVFQHLTINLPYAAEAGHCSIVLRPVVSEDVMTARFAHLDVDVLERIVMRIAALGFVDAIYYDITNKPPATFGWE